MKIARLAIVAGIAGAAVAASAHGAFTSYVIRNDSGGNSPLILPNTDYVPGATEFVTYAASQKAGFGSNDQNGTTVGSLTNLSITRHDDTTRFTAGSGAAVAPYFNIWVTDGVNYAVIANEPSNPDFAAFRTAGPNGSFTYSFSMNDILNSQCNVFETLNAGAKNTWVHAAAGKMGQQLQFSDVIGLTVQAPSTSWVASGNPNGVGGGAPRELGTNIAYGMNWVFGDTLSNYVSGVTEGFVVSGASIVPAPGAAALLGLGGLFAGRRRRGC